MSQPTFVSASPYQEDVLALPVADLDAASRWYGERFGMTEIERMEHPAPRVVLERDGVRIGFAVNGGDAAQEGASIRVTNIGLLKEELESRGAAPANWRVDEWDGGKHQVFFVVAPDGLCFYFHEPLADT